MREEQLFLRSFSRGICLVLRGVLTGKWCFQPSGQDVSRIFHVQQRASYSYIYRQERMQAIYPVVWCFWRAYHLRANSPGVCEGGRQKEESMQIMVIAIEQNTCGACYVAQCIAFCANTTFEWPEASYIMLYGNEVRQNTLTCDKPKGQRRRI